MKTAIVDAREKIRSRIRLTACRFSAALSDAGGADVFLKLENTQLSGSFKIRGVLNKLLSLTPEERSRRLVAASTGNHGAAFAHGVNALGLHGLLFLPTTATGVKLEAIEASGIPHELVGSDCVIAENHAHAFAEANGCTWVSPYNDPEVIAGQGTIGPELVEQCRDGLDAVLIPVGGGGLAGGIAAYLKAVAPAVEIIGVEPEASAVMAESVAAGRIVELANLPTLSDATAGGIEAGSITFDLCREHVDRWERVAESEIADAVRFVHDNDDMVIEGGAALGVALLLRCPEYLAGKRIAVIITGSRIDPEVLAGIVGGESSAA
ncbi:MAG: pyridoxal-phosphate dependent enzyme [Thermoanaerobaculales bacterium]|nr:pyridoxal-phosphate dependent enzyme [Thermoanaerobaculales bacterium]